MVAVEPLCTRTLVVKEVPSTVMMPLVRQGPCYGSFGPIGIGQILAEHAGVKLFSGKALGV